jgi:hypothetical protein
LDLRKAGRTAQAYAAPFGREGLDPTHCSANIPDTLRNELQGRSFPLGPGEQSLDIGANRGQTIVSIRLYKPVAPIVAFEPNPILARRLTKRYAGDRNITIHSFGVGLERGHFDLYVPYYRGSCSTALPRSTGRQPMTGSTKKRSMALTGGT